MPDNVPQNPAESQPTEGNQGNPGSAPAQAPQPAEESSTISHRAYAALQTKLNNRNTAYNELETSFKALEESAQQAETLANARLQDLTQARTQTTQLTEELQSAQSRLMKVDAFNALINDPESGLDLSPQATMKLFGLLGDIPAGKDVDETKAAIKRFAEFGQSVAQETHRQADAGSTPPYESSGNVGEPQDLQGWMKAVEGKDPDDPIWTRFFEFTNQRK